MKIIFVPNKNISSQLAIQQSCVLKVRMKQNWQKW